MYITSRTAPRDYLEKINETVTFAPGQQDQFVAITIVDGATFRDDVEFYGVLSLPVDSVGVVLGVSEVSVLIIEDEREFFLLL